MIVWYHSGMRAAALHSCQKQNLVNQKNFLFEIYDIELPVVNPELWDGSPIFVIVKGIKRGSNTNNIHYYNYDHNYCHHLFNFQYSVRKMALQQYKTDLEDATNSLKQRMFYNDLLVNLRYLSSSSFLARSTIIIIAELCRAQLNVV